MAYRTVYLTVESGGFTTNGDGEWVDFYVTSGGEAFGAYEPYAIEIDFSGVTSYYGSSVTHAWKIKISGDGDYGEYGDDYETIAEFSRSMYDDTANFDLGYTTLGSSAISILKNYGLTNIGIFQNNDRRIVGKSSASAVATIYYNEPSYDWNYGPSNVQVSQNNDGTFKISWNAASWSGGSSYIKYYIYCPQISTDNYFDIIGETSKKYTIPGYSTDYTFYISAYENQTGSWAGDSIEKTYNFTAPYVTAPTISISPTSGISTTITRTNSSLKYTDGEITYNLYRNNILVGTFSDLTYTISQDTLDSWNSENIEFQVKVTTSNLTNNYGSPLTNKSNTVTFKYNLNKTILYYTGNGSINGYEECIVYYYTGNLNEGDNGWVECEPYIYTGESNATINGWQLCSYT